jgi:hypothetical protein
MNEQDDWTPSKRTKIGLGLVIASAVFVVLATVTGNGNIVVAMLLIPLYVGAYLLPSIVASARHSHLTAPVAIVNIFLGWTFIGWVVALAMAVTSKREV